MDPVTHAVIGMAISKMTGNAIALTEPASLAIIIGSVFPDIDIILQKWGDYVYLKNHRGVTHSIIGLIISSMLIAAVMSIFFPQSNIPGLFLWSLLGCLSHSFIDIFNSYGAKLMWPFFDKKFSLSLLLVFDPIFFGLLSGYVLSSGSIKSIFIICACIYLISRALMRLGVAIGLKKRFGVSSKDIKILPSMTGLFRWHFILEREDYDLVGEKNILKRGIKVFKRLYKLQGGTPDKILFSNVGRFFGEFTPLSHIVCINAGNITRYIFIDLRYFIRNNFLHHAVLEMDRDNRVVMESFNPYSIKRSTPLTIK